MTWVSESDNPYDNYVTNPAKTLITSLCDVSAAPGSTGSDAIIRSEREIPLL
jgi:hypothetical protein